MRRDELILKVTAITESCSQHYCNIITSLMELLSDTASDRDDGPEMTPPRMDPGSEAKLRAALQRLEEAKEDYARLDWMSVTGGYVYNVEERGWEAYVSRAGVLAKGATGPREAIDAAMKAYPSKPSPENPESDKQWRG